VSDDESFITVASAVLALVVWMVWYLRLGRRGALGLTVPGRGVLSLAPLGCAALIIGVLTTIASHDVINDPKYIFQYAAMGMAWVGVGTHMLFEWLGISARDDLMERRNPAVVPVLSGGMLGLACCFAGGNVGDGPGWWVVVFAAVLATAGLMMTWGIWERVAHLSDQVTIERDLAAGHRLGGFLFGTGIIMGRAVAGDWISAGDTIADFFAVAWPVVVLLLVAIAIDRSARATPERPEPAVTAFGVMPALIFPLLAFGYVSWLGLPE